MITINTNDDKQSNYDALYSAILDQLETEGDLIANLANISAFIMAFLPELNWAGFYILKNDTLVLGPFQGKPACIRIPLGKGVCGTSAFERRIIRVDNVHEFEGHIACDAASNSEIVLPICKNEELFGVLDIDSPILCRFDDIDEVNLEKIVKLIGEKL